MRYRFFNLLLVLTCCIILSGCTCKHEWKEATCTTPKTCSLCGETEGEILGHTWVDATCTTPKTCSLCGETEGEILDHTWVDATCTAPKTCSECNTTTGKSLAHKWSEATCNDARYCSECQKTFGAALGHDVKEWSIINEATCAADGLEKGVCNRCQDTIERDIPALSHTEGEWVIVEEAGYSDNGIKVLNCTVCGKELKKEEYELTEEEKEELFKAECVTYSYNEIARNPSQYSLEQVKFRGEVIQVIEDGDEYGLRVNITPKKYYWDDTIYVSYTKRSASESRILVDDIIVLYGYFADTITYETVLGASVTIPAVYAIYIDIE